MKFYKVNVVPALFMMRIGMKCGDAAGCGRQDVQEEE